MAAKSYKHNLTLDIEKAVANNEELLDVFPELAAYPEFQAFRGKELNKFIHYLFLAYDPGSGFVNKIKDLDARKDEAAKEAGLNKITSVIKDRVVTAKYLKDQQFTEMLTRFFRSIVQEDEFEEWVSGRELLAQIYENVRNPVDKEDAKSEAIYKLKIENFEKAPKIYKRLKELETLLFKNDKDAMKAVGNEMNTQNMGITEELYLEDD